MNKLPRAAVFQRLRVVGVVIVKSLIQIVGLADVETTARFALQDVNVKNHEARLGGADGVRTRDLLDAIEARSQLRYGPTKTKTRPSR